jgi:hypothetical protein
MGYLLSASLAVLAATGLAERAEAGHWIKGEFEFRTQSGTLDWVEGQGGSRITVLSHDPSSFVVRRSWRGNAYTYRVRWQAPERVIPGAPLPFRLEVTCLEAVRGDLPPDLPLTREGAAMYLRNLLGQGDRLEVGGAVCSPGRSDPAPVPSVKVPAGAPGASFVAAAESTPAAWYVIHAMTTYHWSDAAPPQGPSTPPSPDGAGSLGPSNAGPVAPPPPLGTPSSTPSPDVHGASPTPTVAPPSDWVPPIGGDGTAPMPSVPEPAVAENGVGGAVTPGVRRPTELTLREPTFATLFVTYHYGARRPPGHIGLKHESGIWYGPWPAAGGVGQGGMPNAYWYVRPNIVLPAGRYAVFDSDPDTWTHEASTGGQGIYILRGRRP